MIPLQPFPLRTRVLAFVLGAALGWVIVGAVITALIWWA